MKAIILAGGKGTRLWPFTASFPKPLVPLGDTPVLEVLIRQLIRQGITDVTLTLGHLAELIMAYFSNRKTLAQQLHLQYVVEEVPTGTAGSLSLVSGLTETFLVMNGDLLTDLDFNKLIEFHRSQNAVLTIATQARHVKINLGVVETDGQKRITRYHEKPERTYHASMGIYVYEPAALKYIQPGVYLDFPALVLKLIADGQRVCSYQTDCMWLDIGRPDDYAKAQEIFGEKREAFDVV